MSSRLSKSKILSGRQCAKRLWLAVHRPELAAETDAAAQLRIHDGREVNKIARSLHPGGRLIRFDNGVEDAIVDTQKALAADPAAPVFEATFVHEGVAVRVDILKKGKHGYRLIEVKSSTKVKRQHYLDCAVQAWVLEGNGVDVEKVELAHINNEFVYGGDDDYRGLFYHEDVTEKIAAEKAEVPKLASEFQNMLEGEQPGITIGTHCYEPYACPFIAHCTAAEYPVACLPGVGEKSKLPQQFAEEGITDFRDIPAERLRTEKQKWVREVTIRGEADLKPGAKNILGACEWPRYYLDFETVRFAVPVWEDTSPYKQLPFQWSCHIETEPGAVTRKHKKFLGEGAAPMRAFAESLLRELGTRGTVFMISSYEKTILTATAARFPDLAADIEKVIARLVDLQKIAKENYYHPEMRGSWSMKDVAPCIASNLDYGNLGTVQDGNAAGSAYLKMISENTEPVCAKKLKEDLLAYCKRDTEVMVELARVLCGE